MHGPTGPEGRLAVLDNLASEGADIGGLDDEPLI